MYGGSSAAPCCPGLSTKQTEQALGKETALLHFLPPASYSEFLPVPQWWSVTWELTDAVNPFLSASAHRALSQQWER